jgi:3-hydroxyacyl-[acyl-carrier-protein] dehydratase
MNTQEIKLNLLHRWPFLLVDRVTKITKQSIEGYKNVSSGDIVFQGHFPEISIFPGALIVEALAQLCGLMISHQNADPETSGENQKIGLLTGIRKFNFLKVVAPGDQLFLKAVLKGSSGDCCIFSVSAYVDKVEVAAGELQLFQQRKDMVSLNG